VIFAAFSGVCNVIASAAKQSIAKKKDWIASSRSLSSGAHSRDPLAPRNDDVAVSAPRGFLNMAVASIQVSETPLVLYALRRADDALILGHRLSEWCGHAPALEEDMALANMGLDLLGQARELYTYAATVEGKGNDEDKFAYLRDIRQYRNLLLLEQPNGDFARTMTRQFFYSAFADLYWRAMMQSADATLAAIAAKSEKESAYHVRHSSEWLVRLGDGTAESHRRAQGAIDDLWAYTGEMFEVDGSERALIDGGIAVDPAALRPQWLKTVSDVVGEATLNLPKSDWMQQGGRDGRHSEHLGHLLSELQSMPRTFPGATW
jgi:ring-1,2-phenylacetyl-CoA epoxidase subunit PaaC